MYQEPKVKKETSKGYLQSNHSPVPASTDHAITFNSPLFPLAPSPGGQIRSQTFPHSAHEGTYRQEAKSVTVKAMCVPLPALLLMLRISGHTSSVEVVKHPKVPFDVFELVTHTFILSIEPSTSPANLHSVVIDEKMVSLDRAQVKPMRHLEEVQLLNHTCTFGLQSMFFCINIIESVLFRPATIKVSVPRVSILLNYLRKICCL